MRFVLAHKTVVACVALCSRLVARQRPAQEPPARIPENLGVRRPKNSIPLRVPFAPRLLALGNGSGGLSWPSAMKHSLGMKGFTDTGAPGVPSLVVVGTAACGLGRDLVTVCACVRICACAWSEHVWVACVSTRALRPFGSSLL